MIFFRKWTSANFRCPCSPSWSRRTRCGDVLAIHQHAKVTIRFRCPNKSSDVDAVDLFGPAAGLVAVTKVRRKHFLGSSAASSTDLVSRTPPLVASVVLSWKEPLAAATCVVCALTTKGVRSSRLPGCFPASFGFQHDPALRYLATRRSLRKSAFAYIHGMYHQKTVPSLFQSNRGIPKILSLDIVNKFFGEIRRIIQRKSDIVIQQPLKNFACDHKLALNGVKSAEVCDSTLVRARNPQGL